MHEHQQIANPFELMLNPQAVLQAMARSDRLERLQRRICRPLDKPVTPRKESEADAAGADGSETATPESLDKAD